MVWDVRPTDFGNLLRSEDFEIVYILLISSVMVYLVQNSGEYTTSIEQKAGGKITYLTFKDKRNGWRIPTAVAVINSNEIPIKDYVRVFYNRCALRPSCHKCPFATTERKTDITIGDFGYIEKTIPDFYNSDGISVFLIHTDRGEELFNNIKENLEYRLSDTKQCRQANLEDPTPVSVHRQEFWKDYQRKGIDYIMKKYGTVSLKRKVKNKLLRIIEGGYSLNNPFVYQAIYSGRRAV